MKEKRIALFGGTFDPIHIGHTAVAASAVDYISAEKVIFIPVRRSALKDFLPVAGDADRFKMTALAVSNNDKFQLSDYELKKSGPGYTIETVRQFQREFGSETSLHWLLGADSIDDLPKWYKITELIDECNVSVMYRAGWEKPDFSKFTNIWGSKRVEKLQRNVIETPLINISSTEIRYRLASGKDVSDMLCSDVVEYIHKHRLYHS
ncbi:Nicotinate-nucleotide adenylyltransferase [subsurface metagenome]